MNIVITFKINLDFPGPKMICLPQINDFGKNLVLSGPWAIDRPAGTVKEPFLLVFLISFKPPIVGGPADPKASKGFRDVRSHFLEMADNAQPPFLVPQRIVVNW